MARSSRLTTGMSQAHWSSRGELAPARFPGSLAARWRRDSQTVLNDCDVCWIDRLFEGDITLPQDQHRRALTMLLTGPPGAGKSTFALELCYRAQLQIGSAEFQKPQCLYVTTESNLSLMKQQAVSFGWQNDWLYPATKEKLQDCPPFTAVLETNDFRTYLQNGDIPWYLKLIGTVQFPDIGVPPIDAQPAVVEAVQVARRNIVDKVLQNAKPDILVIDSLNTTPDGNRESIFRIFNEIVTASGNEEKHLPKLIVFVLDSPEGDHQPWGYVCDIIVRLDRRYASDYMVRTIEIEKARYQAHAWGSHQLKIYGHQASDPQASDPQASDDAKHRQQHPYRSEGGIFVFPSIHFYLSHYKRTGATELEFVGTPFHSLDEMLGGEGIPAGRCLGLLGTRGGHKSHLGYRHILNGLCQDQSNSALIISLRDDERVAQFTMDQILTNELNSGGVTVPKLMAKDRLEIMYFPPGYITPEEFFHRVCLGVQRLKHAAKHHTDGDRRITLLFNSLDQLGARFPLCAKEQIFVPGLIQMLNAESVTSIFIGVEESGQPEQQYGLLSMADTILRAQRERTASYEIARSPSGTSDWEHQYFAERIKNDDSVVVLHVARVAAGHAAGGLGLLDLAEDLNHKRRLVFEPVKRRDSFKARERQSSGPTSGVKKSTSESVGTTSTAPEPVVGSIDVDQS